MSYAPDTFTYSVFTTLVINSALGFIFLMIFERCRYRRDVYTPRIKRPQLPNVVPPPRGLFAWVRHVAAISDEETLRVAGIDAYVFLRFVRLLATLFPRCVLGACILFPVYSTAQNSSVTPGIQRVGMGNLPVGSPRLWATTFVVWFYTLYALYLLYEEYRVFYTLRQTFFERGDNTFGEQGSYTCLLENVPAMENQTWLYELMCKLFPSEVYSVNVMVGTSTLPAKIAEREALVAKYESCYAAEYATGEPVMVSVKADRSGTVMCCGGEKVEAIPFYAERIAIADEEIRVLQTTARGVLDGTVVPEDSKQKMLTTAFVTFTSRRAAMIASQLPILSETEPYLKAYPAPAPTDVIWKNMASSRTSSDIGILIVTVLLILGMLFWGVIIAFIGAVSTLDNIAPFLPFIALLDPVSKSILAGLLPVVVLAVFLSLLPVIMAALATGIEKRRSFSDVQYMVCKWFFLYSMTNVYLVLLAGSLFNALSAAIANPLSIIDLLGKAIPSVAVFFINFTIAQLCFGIPMRLSRLVPLIMAKIYRGCFNEKKLTLRTVRYGVFADAEFNYGVEIPNIMYPTLVVFLYWVIQPVILLLGALYFPAIYMVYKYQFLYVFVAKFQTGGRFFYQIFDFAHAALMIGSLAILGFMAIKQGIGETIILIPLPVVVFVAKRYTVAKFFHLTNHSALSMIDTQDSLLAKRTENFSDTFYMQPVLKVEAAQAYPYRVDEIPLFNENEPTEVNEVYYDGAKSQGSQAGQSGPWPRPSFLAETGVVNALAENV